MQNNQHQIILASRSRARAALLEMAGVDFIIEPADIDENVIRDDFLLSPDPLMSKLAQTLAEQKAIEISHLHPDKYIIGADQLLVLEDKIFSKPETLEKAKSQLLQLRGKTHHLISAVSVVKDTQIAWTYTEEAEMQMRDFTENFLDQYIKTNGGGILSCVGGYQLEGVGAQLFSGVKGDYFTVLGLPLIPLLEFFRSRNILNT